MQVTTADPPNASRNRAAATTPNQRRRTEERQKPRFLPRASSGVLPGGPRWHASANKQARWRASANKMSANRQEAHLRLIEGLAGIALLLTSAAVAQPPSLIAEDAWVRATPGADSAAAYLTLRNVTSSPVTVTSVESPIAAHAMIHETSTQGGLSRMRAREALTIAPRSTVRFAPGGLHVMLHDLKQPLTVGEQVPLIITLSGGSTLQVTAAVRPLGSE